MGVRVEDHTGLHRVAALTSLLQRARCTDRDAGFWDAADIQWWWRRPRPTDEAPLPVWYDDDGPVGAAVVTDWGDRWQADALVVPDAFELEPVWSAVLACLAEAPPVTVEVLAREDDDELLGLLEASGFRPTDERSGLTWMNPGDRPPVAALPDGYRIVDRLTQPGGPHPMQPRNGEAVEDRLRQCSLYDPWLDLAVETADGAPAGYALFWHDPTTGVGMVEPMRVEGDHQRRGLGRALLTAGLDRLAARGAQRLKVGFDGEAGRALYLGAGFEEAAMVRQFLRPPATAA